MTEPEYIKAHLDLLKMTMAALLGIMLVILWTILQNSLLWDKKILIGAIIINAFFGYYLNEFYRHYLNLANKLKDLP